MHSLLAFVATLPQPQEVAQYGLNLLSVGNVMEFVAGIVTMTPAMLAHERVGNAESALECAAIITEAGVLRAPFKDSIAEALSRVGSS